jgi:hypothetical protein
LATDLLFSRRHPLLTLATAHGNPRGRTLCVCELALKTGIDSAVPESAGGEEERDPTFADTVRIQRGKGDYESDKLKVCRDGRCVSGILSGVFLSVLRRVHVDFQRRILSIFLGASLSITTVER